MLSWVVTFLIIALIAAVLGFGGIAAGAAEIAKIIFYISIIRRPLRITPRHAQQRAQPNQLSKHRVHARFVPAEIIGVNNKN